MYNQVINRNQSQVAYNDTNNVQVKYESIESFKEHLLYASMQQASIFHAMDMIKEVEKINNQQFLNSYEIKKIKSHFLDNHSQKIKSEKMEIRIEKSQIKIEESQKENSQIKIKIMQTETEKSKSHKPKRNPYVELQKAYMKMLSPTYEA